MIIIAKLFKLFFKIPLLRKNYYKFYKYLFNPLKMFNNLTIDTLYDGDIKIKLHLKDWIQQQIYFTDYFDYKGIKFLKHTLKEGDVFFDVGTNIGSYSLVASKIVGNSGKVYSFEPVTKTLKKLTETVERNNFNNIQIEKKIVSDKNESINIYASPDNNTGMSSIIKKFDNVEPESVPSVILDEYIINQKIKTIALVKIDVEGAEFHVLKGMKNILTNIKPILFIEIINDNLETTSITSQEIIDFILNFNYSIYATDKNGKAIPFKSLKNSNYHNYIFIPNKVIF